MTQKKKRLKSLKEIVMLDDMVINFKGRGDTIKMCVKACLASNGRAMNLVFIDEDGLDSGALLDGGDLLALSRFINNAADVLKDLE